MVDDALAQTSNTLFNVAFITYITAMVAYFFRMAFTSPGADQVEDRGRTGRVVGLIGTALAAGGAAVHLGSIVTRGLAAGRTPWANMYEYASLMALLAVVGALLIVQRRYGYGHLVGFVLAAAILMMTSAILLFAEAGPVLPALNSYWIQIHTSSMMISSSIMIVAFAVTALYLVKDTAERRVANSSTAFGASSVGAGSLAAGVEAAERPEGFVEDSGAEALVAPAYAQRRTLSPVLFPVVPFAVIGLFVVLVWRQPVAAFSAATIAALLGTATWYAVPYLPPAARMDALAARTVAFGFPLLTFGIMAGAIWAEEAWGRYWGWDPKETGSFFTWVLYAAYLHARSTAGWRGRRAAWVGVVAFVALMITFYVVNLWIVGFHSYAGV